MYVQTSVDVLPEPLPPETSATAIAEDVLPAGLVSGPRMITSRLAIAGLMLRLRMNVVRQALRLGATPEQVLRALRLLRKKRIEYFGNSRLKKFIRVGDRTFWTLEAPGFPGPALDMMLQAELKRVLPGAAADLPQRVVFLGITKKCPMACEHCYDWHNHNGREVLEVEDLVRIVGTFQDRGVAQIFLSGGEPLARFRDMISLLETSRPGTDFWVLTSGYKLTLERAGELRTAGLTGVSISLDHHDPEAHDRFRGVKDSYDWVVRATRNANEAGLVVALSVCVTRSYATEENLMAYAALAKRLGAAFVQVLEPRAVGRYDGEDVSLTEDQLVMLSAFYLRVNFDDRYRDWPIVSYHGFHQRTLGCAGAGDRFLYVDADGDVHACPFCQESQGNVLCGSLDDSIAALQSAGCMAFSQAKH
jgi:MoaA/NifB/PqqE/SkfB family radical SAM enzyme